MRLLARLFVFASALFILLYGVLPGLFKPEGDFISAFVAGRSFLHGIDPVTFYKFLHFQRLIDLNGFSDRIYSFVSTPPSSIMVDAVLGIFPISVARFLSTGVNILAFMLLVHATARVAGSSVRMTYLIFLSSSYALATNFESGEPTLVLALLFVLSFHAFLIGRQAASGAFLGLAFPFNPFAAIPAALFLISTKWRTFSYFLAASVLILLVTYIAVGQSTLIYYFQRILPYYVNGKVLNPFSDSYQTGWSLLRRVFVYNQTLNLHPLLKSETLYVFFSSVFKACVIVPPAYFFYKALRLNNVRDALVAASFPIILLSPVTTSPELIFLAPAIVVLAQSAFEAGKKTTASAFVLLYAAACLPLFSFINDLLNYSNPIVDYERLLILIAAYILYLYFQRRVVPVEARKLRLALITVIIGAVTITFYAGDRIVQHTNAVSLTPALQEDARSNIAFSPAVNSGTLSCIQYDSSTATLLPTDLDARTLESGNYYRYCSDAGGKVYALEDVRDGDNEAIFRTRGTEARYIGHDVSVSPDGDYGAFIDGGKIYTLDLDPRYISPEDTLSLLPYTVSECSFNASRNFEIDFLIDSLNSSYSIGTYNLFNHKITTRPAPFPASLLCADGDTFYVAYDMSDSTGLWALRPDTAPQKLLSLNAEIYDLSVIKHSLYLSSNFGRGLNYPTIYQFVAGIEPENILPSRR